MTLRLYSLLGSFYLDHDLEAVLIGGFFHLDHDLEAVLIARFFHLDHDLEDVFIAGFFTWIMTLRMCYWVLSPGS